MDETEILARAESTAERTAKRLEEYVIRDRHSGEPIGFVPSPFQRAVLTAEAVARAYGMHGVIVLQHRIAGLTTLQLACMDYDARSSPAHSVALTHSGEAKRAMMALLGDLAEGRDPVPQQVRVSTYMEGIGKGWRMRRILLDNACWARDLAHTWACVSEMLTHDGTIVVASPWFEKSPGADVFAEMWLSAVEGRNRLLPLFYPWWRSIPGSVAEVSHGPGAAVRAQFRPGPSLGQIAWYDDRVNVVMENGGSMGHAAGEFPSDDTAVIHHALAKRRQAREALRPAAGPIPRLRGWE